MTARKRDGRGGARPGAGRKPTLSEPKYISLLVEQATADELARLADDERMSPAAYLRRVLEQHVARKRRRSR